MRNYSFFIILLLSQFVVTAQETYSEMTSKALETMWSAQDTLDYRKALNLYEKAFLKFPDSINGTGLYKASVLASELKEFDTAFKYLTPLSEMEKDEDGYPGWSYVVEEYSREEYKNLLDDARWAGLEKKAIENRRKFYEKLAKNKKEFFAVNKQTVSANGKPDKLYSNIKNYNPYLPKQQQDYSIAFKINDTLKTSYHVHLPESYNPKKRYSMLVFLHGAVKGNMLHDYQIPQENLGGWNRFYTKYASKSETILVFLSGSKDYNWMMPDDGFYMIPEVVKQIKTAINIDDNKIFISGHSNGATGSFSYLMKKPTQFAGFYGFNTYPKVFTGGTFIENALNRSFINFSTDQDYYYPPNANDSLTKLMTSINADYKDYRYNGFPHWFPEFDESEPAYEILFSDLTERKRNPFPDTITWEFDDEKYGTVDWITEVKLDTITSRQVWHKPLNFKINKWLKYDDNDTLVTLDVDRNAFDFPRKSGKIKASYQNNVFTITTSCIKSFTIEISPEMVNLTKKVQVYVNGKRYFNGKIDYDEVYMLKNFEKNSDRAQVWVNFIKIEL